MVLPLVELITGVATKIHVLKITSFFQWLVSNKNETYANRAACPSIPYLIFLNLLANFTAI